MKKVLIALDYDPTAQKVAETGFSLAKAMGAEVILLHVITDPVFYYSREYSPIMGIWGSMDTSQFQLDNIDGLRKATLHFLEKFKLHLGDESIQILIKEGEIGDSILKTAKSLHADIIVLGTHSQRWLENIIMGSVAEKVLRHTKIPLLIIPTKKHD
jgi:nucleotide-binding universal stress UspA family protein